MWDTKAACAAVLREASDDYVGVWRISRALYEAGPDSPRDHVATTVAVVEELIGPGGLQIGQFLDGVFVAWTGTVGERVERLRGELSALGRDPDVGEVAWLVSSGVQL